MEATIWDQVLARIETKGNRHSFYTWFRPTTLLSDGGGALTIVDASGVEFSSMAKVRKNDPVCLIGLRLHILDHGATFNLHTRVAAAAPEMVGTMNSSSVRGPAKYGSVPSANSPVTRNALGPMGAT